MVLKQVFRGCPMLVLLLLLFNGVFAQQPGAIGCKEIFEGNGYENGRKLKGLEGGTGWAGPWTGAAENIRVRNQGIVTDAGTTGKASAYISPAPVPQFLLRKVNLVAGARWSTVWVSFSVSKESGKGKLGLTLINNGNERLFVGFGGNRQFFAGDQPLKGVSDDTGHRIFVRIDRGSKEDIAYVFADPGETSNPDIEGAHVVLKGQFIFNEIKLGTDGADIKGAMGPIRVGSQFQDVVMAGGTNLSASAAVAGDYKVRSWEKNNSSLDIRTNSGILKITPYLPGAVRVQFGSKQMLGAATDYAVSIHPENSVFDVTEAADALFLKTQGFTMRILKANSGVAVMSREGKVLLTEKEPIVRQLLGENGGQAPASLFQLSNGESLYGLGQFRDGALNLRGKRRELTQVNTQVALPIVLSTGGWGLFWDNPTRTIFQDSEQGMELSSDAGSGLSYYVFVGASMDELIGGYRGLTGQVPLLPEWALGYHQSRNKYATQDELLSVAERMRKEHIPFSSIFIDYYYWGKYGTGSHRFDEAQFPDIPSMIRKLHESYHARVIATVWPAFRPGSANYDEMEKQGYLLEGVKALDGYIYDTFNPKAAALYINQVKKQLLPTQIDGWFLDGPEPDNVASFLKSTTYLGPASTVRNLYPLFHSRNFYNGLNESDTIQRHYIMTRSAWASQQQYGTVIWSGDIESSFEELKKQIPAGLNFAASGFPYWTTDIGGYSGGNPADPAYQEVFVRWWQYGTFCPVFRSHGRRFPGDTKGPNELWAYGSKVQQICTSYDELRYRLLPYVYSLSAKVTHEAYTPMRLLAFDFPNDVHVRDLKDQFMYGPAFLVCPVTEAGASERTVYFPAGSNWIDFWTGRKTEGGQSLPVRAPMEQMPLFVKSGSIIPMGPSIQYTDQTVAGPMVLRIYPGADDKFEIYEDDGSTTAYKKKEYTTIPISWDDRGDTLTIGKRKGYFPGMPQSREFKIVLVDGQQPTGMSFEAGSGQSVTYTGLPIKLKINQKTDEKP